MRSLVIALVLLVLAAAAHAGNVDNLSTYAVLLGRGAACGADVDAPSNRVGAWIDKTWSGKNRTAMILVLAQGMEMSARDQAEGRSPDTCAQVRKALAKMQWP